MHNVIFFIFFRAFFVKQALLKYDLVSDGLLKFK